MISAELHLILHPQAVALDQIRRKLGIYYEMYLLFSNLLPEWLMYEFNNAEAKSDQEETYAKFIAFELGLPAYISLSLMVETEVKVQGVIQRIIQELDDTFLPFKVPYRISVQPAELIYLLSTSSR